MSNRFGQNMVLGWIMTALLTMAGTAQAVSLGKIEVASHLGEPFYAEIPLSLDANESISRVFVEIASPTDYRILEVYRDVVLNSLRADVESDSRGSRIELSSRNAIDAPFFNLVLKVRYDRATHFKKYPIFLDLPKSIKPAARSKPLPSVHALKSPAGVDTTVSEADVMAAQPVAAAPEAESPAPAFRPFDGWARTSRYGPMVYGDTISTVAQRLRVDDRFTRQQVMVALFEKNRAKFDQDNINLIKAGTFLDVPRASEVERITPNRARQLIAEHEKVWKELKKQPRYAAVAEAQRTRYSKRVRIGKQATGMAAQPESAKPATAVTEANKAAQGKGNAAGAAGPAGESSAAADDGSQAGDSALAKQLQALKQQNEQLQAKLEANEKKLAALESKPADADVAAAKAQVAKLEMRLARLQAELDAAREKVAVQSEGGTNWLTWLLGGIAVVLLGVIGFLMRREPTHPAAAGGASPETPASVAAAASSGDEIPEIEVEEADVEALQGGEAATEETAQMTVEQEQQFTDSIPDLTDEDTGSMPAFQEEVEEEPDPNVDYLSEADVYMRYGMEDEALQQVNLALRLDPNNAEAHIKKAEILQSKGDNSAFEETIAEATQTLAGSDLDRFNEVINELRSGTAPEDISDVSLEDTLPPTDVSEMIGEEAAREEGTISEIDDLGFGDAEIDTRDESEGVDTIIEPAGAEDTAELDAALFELDNLELGGEDAEAEAEAAEGVPSEAQAEPETAPAEAASTAEASAEAQSEPEVSFDAGDEGLDFDLSDVDLPEEGEAAGGEAEGPQVETADLEKTVAMDWSKDTSVDSDEIELMGESGADEIQFEEIAESDVPVAAPEEDKAEQAEEAEAEALDISFDEEPAVEPEPEPSAEAGAPAEPGSAAEETAASLDLGEGDLDAGFDISEAEVEPVDDFTSTIRTSLDKVAEEADDFTATGEHNLQINEDASENLDESMLESVGEEPSGEEKASPSDDSLGGVLELEDDVDATQKLDNLLSEFSDEDEDKKDQ